jgi:hypothetical protein
MISSVFVCLYILFAFLVAHTLGRTRKIGFAGSFIICLLLSPFIGFLITMGGAMTNPRGCRWCGNKDNEAEYCGLCGKNEQGEIWKGYIPKSQSQKDILDS